MVWGGCYGNVYGLMWDCLALFHMAFAFQACSVAQIEIYGVYRDVRGFSTENVPGK